MNWSKYGKWLHPKVWWEGKLTKWLTENPKEYGTPTILEVRKTEIVFGVKGVMGRLIVSKEKILREIGEIDKLSKDEFKGSNSKKDIRVEG